MHILSTHTKEPDNTVRHFYTMLPFLTKYFLIMVLFWYSTPSKHWTFQKEKRTKECKSWVEQQLQHRHHLHLHPHFFYFELVLHLKKGKRRKEICFFSLKNEHVDSTPEKWKKKKKKFLGWVSLNKTNAWTLHRILSGNHHCHYWACTLCALVMWE